MNLPEKYKWLENESGPKMLLEAIKLFETEEKIGAQNNPVIMSWANEIGGAIKKDYSADSVPWCGLFMGIIARRANKELPTDILWAQNWSTFGKLTIKPMLGDILVFKVENGHGHVALYVGEDTECYHILGGNQSDKVCIIRKEKKKVLVARRPNYINQPENVRQIILSPVGEISKSEV